MKLKKKIITEAENIQQHFLNLCPILLSEIENCSLHHPSWVNLQSSHFCKGVYVLLSFNIIRPQFDIVVFHDHVVLCVNFFWGTLFSAH